MTAFTVDLCIVAGRRPDLLQRTLGSFSEKVFSKFAFSNVLINIDAIFGSDDDEKTCLQIVKGYFPSAIAFTPETPGFGAAVKRLWTNSRSDYVFHIEDDWIALTEIGQEVFVPFSNPNVMQVSFHTADQKWDIAKKGHLHRRNEYLSLMGLKIPLFRTFPIFTTSPSLLRGSFARQAAALMDENRDPEKQFYYGVNAGLEQLASRSRNYIFSPRRTPVIQDTGREWRAARKINKVIENATSHWIGP